MVAVLVDEYRPSPRRSLLSAVDEYVAGPRTNEAQVESPLANAVAGAPVAPLPVQPRPRTVRPVRPAARQQSATSAQPARTAAPKAREAAPKSAPLPTVEVRSDWSVARSLAAPTPRRSLAPTHVLASPQRVGAASTDVHKSRSAAPVRVLDVTTSAVYVWRRIAVAALAVLALAAGWGLFSALGGASLVASERRSTTVTYTVRSGDSLWSVAKQVAPQEDPRRVVADLERTRGGAPLLPGETVIWTR